MTIGLGRNDSRPHVVSVIEADRVVHACSSPDDLSHDVCNMRMETTRLTRLAIRANIIYICIALDIGFTVSHMTMIHYYHTVQRCLENASLVHRFT
jgi:hypothetical protein